MQVHRHKRFTLQTLSPRINPPRRKWRGLEKILGVLVLLGETSPLAILRSQGRVDRGYVELHCGTFLMTFIAFLIGYYKAAQETGSKIVPKFHWAQFRPVARATSKWANRKKQEKGTGFRYFYIYR